MRFLVISGITESWKMITIQFRRLSAYNRQKEPLVRWPGRLVWSLPPPRSKNTRSNQCWPRQHRRPLCQGAKGLPNWSWFPGSRASGGAHPSCRRQVQGDSVSNFTSNIYTETESAWCSSEFSSPLVVVWRFPLNAFILLFFKTLFVI